MPSPRRIAALVVFILPWIMWAVAIGHASASGFLEDKYAVQLMMISGAVSMVAGCLYQVWE
jgi:hypothetical protein